MWGSMHGWSGTDTDSRSHMGAQEWGHCAPSCPRVMLGMPPTLTHPHQRVLELAGERPVDAVALVGGQESQQGGEVPSNPTKQFPRRVLTQLWPHQGHLPLHTPHSQPGLPGAGAWLAVSALCPPCLTTALTDAFRPPRLSLESPWSLSLSPSAHSCNPEPPTSHHPPSTLSLRASAFPGGNEGHENPSAVRRLEEAWEQQLFPGKRGPLELGGAVQVGQGENGATLRLLPRATASQALGRDQSPQPALWGQR